MRIVSLNQSNEFKTHAVVNNSGVKLFTGTFIECLKYINERKPK